MIGKTFMVSLIPLVLLISAVSAVFGQLSTYTWTHKIAINTTAQDSTFKYRWEYVTVWADTVDIQVKIGASASGIDTTNWSSRPYITISQGEKMVFGPTEKLRRLQFKTTQGNGNIFFLGVKKRRQH